MKDEKNNPEEINYPNPNHYDDADNAYGDLEEIQSPEGDCFVQEASVAYDVSPQVEATLRRYLEIQKQLKQLEDERQVLRDILVRHMQARRSTYWRTNVDGASVDIRSIPQTVVTYNESLLRERLGNRYNEILELDLKKLKDHLPEAQPLLASLLPIVGTPSREKIRDACEQGRMTPDEFKGAFTKTETQRFAVAPTRNNPEKNTNSSRA